ncbi:MAG: N-formylglutamate amidohydrolase [Bacteroidales bacterium]|nr:N-formylglutamate amidohydrolase [Bacteroidales bacterium]MCF8456487.1 N-formylglutamate amidohydrolase [Bacteroidales bacterium]
MNDQNKIWETHLGNGPLVATAIHDGHRLRPEVAVLIALSDTGQLQEEDPFTGIWTSMGNTRIIATHSRFEVDLNRPREKAVYILPEDAWGLNVWKSDLPAEIIDRSLAEYDAFYAEAHKLFSDLEKRYGRFVVFDLHSYCYRRESPDGPPADAELNPEVNIGTGTMDREKWAPLVDRFMSDLGNYDYDSRKLDVRENIKFKGGQFGRWIHQNFQESACCLSVEFKKFFMDEWTGIPDQDQIKKIDMALQSTVKGVLEELKQLGAKW